MKNSERFIGHRSLQNSMKKLGLSKLPQNIWINPFLSRTVAATVKLTLWTNKLKLSYINLILIFYFSGAKSFCQYKIRIVWGFCQFKIRIIWACNFIKSITHPWVFFTFFKVYKWYQTAQRTTQNELFCGLVDRRKVFSLISKWGNCRRFSSMQSRSNQQSCSMQRAVLKNSAIFTGKHLCWSIFLIKLQAFALFTQVFSCEYCDIFKNTSFEDYSRTTAFKKLQAELKPSQNFERNCTEY